MLFLVNEQLLLKNYGESSLNCMIIYLGALIYPLMFALNVGTFCELTLRIKNELMSEKCVF